MELLGDLGAQIGYNDPHIPVLPSMRRFRVPALKSQELSPEFLAEQDCVVIVADHSAYDYEFIVRHARLVVDTRNATRNVANGREKIYKA
jgi:UDP-N-acetyl-D-glucosamine dehydrogenase